MRRKTGFRSELLRISAVLAAACAAPAAAAEDTSSIAPWQRSQPLNNYGHVGLLEMPSARMMRDGEIAISYIRAPNATRTVFTFQVFPWLEGTFRYSQLYDYFGPDDALYDRSFGLKLRLLEETDYLPSVTLGIQDLIGTGIYGGEYLAASKSFGPVDATIGIGWGRLGSSGMLRNPLGALDERFYTRPVFDPLNDTGGLPTLKSYFRGPTSSIFGGLVWTTPIDGLRLIAEYSGDAYLDESGRGLFTPKSQFNFGVSYRPIEMIETSAAWLYGNTFSLRVSLRLDPSTEAGKPLDPPALPPVPRPVEQRRADVPPPRPEEIGLRGASAVPPPADLRGAQTDGLATMMTSGAWFSNETVRQQVIEGILRQAKDQNIEIEAYVLQPHYIAIYYRNGHYYRETEAIHRLLRLLTTLPPSVEYFYLTSLVSGSPATEVMVSRSRYEEAAASFASGDNLLSQVSIRAAPVRVPDGAVFTGEAYPRFDWFIQPRLNTVIFDSKDPVGIGVQVAAGASLDLSGGWRLAGVWSSQLYDAIQDIQPNNSLLPPVRSDFKRYLKDGAHGIQSFTISKVGKFGDETFYMLQAGLLEDMFAGAGGEIVWKPTGADWAVGANLYAVRQRGYDRLFQLQDYGVITGQASFYWSRFWGDLNLNVHAGRYLAGDYGGTIELTRRFDTGVEIGAFATFTNVSFDKFGEGSFDKGLIIRIPLGWFAPFNSQIESVTYLRSLSRDGGARLFDVNPLYDMLRRTDEGHTRQSWPRDVTPGL